jgi:LuxR family maltose regulon positive regulatory protein
MLPHASHSIVRYSEADNDLETGSVSRRLAAKVQGSGENDPRERGSDLHDTTGLILDPITERELEVLKLLDSDLSNREIAARLFVSLDTIKSHTRHLYTKLGVHNRHQAVALARDLKLL